MKTARVEKNNTTSIKPVVYNLNLKLKHKWLQNLIKGVIQNGKRIKEKT